MNPVKKFLLYAREVLVFKPYYTVAGLPLVWRFINRRSRSLYASSPATVSGEAQRVILDLRRDGIAVTSLEALFPGHAVLKDLQDEFVRLRPLAHVSGKKPFLLEVFNSDSGMHPHEAFTELAVAPVMVDIINGYMGLWSRFFYHMLAVTIPGGDAAVARESQRWHRDPEDARMCKFFVYLNDVDQEAGPFTYMKGTHQEGLYRSYFPQKRPKGSYPPEGAVEKYIPQKQMVVCTGKAGTVVLADTSGLHRGGYAKSKERVMFTAGYYSDAASTSLRYRVTPQERESFLMRAPSVQHALHLD